MDVEPERRRSRSRRAGARQTAGDEEDGEGTRTPGRAIE